jgi:hypothetical protein
MCRISLHSRLDSLGIAGFSHDFGTLRGKYSVVAEVLDSFGGRKLTFVDTLKLVLSLAFPFLINIPTERFNLFKRFKSTAKEISQELLQRTRKEKKEDLEDKKDHSVIGLLSMFSPSTQGHDSRGAESTSRSVRASSNGLERPMSDDEVTDQVKPYSTSSYTRTIVTRPRR